MLDVGSRVRVCRSHWLAAGAAGRIIMVEHRRPSGEPRACPFHVELDKPLAGGLRQLWFSGIDLVPEQPGAEA